MRRASSDFAERPAPGSGVTKGQTAGVGFWANKKGQALIGTFENIGPWLANTMPHLFGEYAGADNLANRTAAQVAERFLETFVVHDKLDAQVVATALSVYATRASLGGSTAAAYGFGVSQYGLGDVERRVQRCRLRRRRQHHTDHHRHPGNVGRAVGAVRKRRRGAYDGQERLRRH